MNAGFKLGGRPKLKPWWTIFCEFPALVITTEAYKPCILRKKLPEGATPTLFRFFIQMPSSAVQIYIWHCTSQH